MSQSVSASQSNEDVFKVLIVDDDLTVLGLLQELVSMVPGCKALAASNPEEAMKFIVSEQVDIVFTDIHMPGVTGVEMLKDIIALEQTPEVIVMTAYPTGEIAQETMELGATSLLSKPFEDISVIEIELDRCIKKILRQRAAAKEVEEKKAIIAKRSQPEVDSDPAMKVSLPTPDESAPEAPEKAPEKGLGSESAPVTPQTEEDPILSEPPSQKSPHSEPSVEASAPEVSLDELPDVERTKKEALPVYPFDVMRPLVEIEMKRSDRHKRQFSVGFVDVPENLELATAKSREAFREEQLKKLQSVFRTSDVIIDAERDGFGIIAFECNRAGASVLEFKLAEAGFGFNGFSVYPVHGQTFEDLVSDARSKLQEKRKHKILLLESEDFFGQIVNNMLVDPKYQVVWERESDSAYKLLMEESESIKLMVVSLTKDAQQWELLAKCKQENLITFPIVLFSDVSLDPQLKDQLQQLGIRAVVKKGSSQEDFLYVVQSFVMQPSVTVMRKNPRALTTLPVVYRVNGEAVSSNTFTISRDGIFIRDLNPPAADTIVEIELFIPERTQPLRAKAQVLYSVPYFVGVNRIHVPGMALKFEELSEELKDELDQVVAGALTSYLIEE